jgi:murein peptide amidase A
VRLLALLLAALPVGHSVQGRAIRPVVLGSPTAAHRLLVVGCIHGNEAAGLAITRALVRAGRVAGAEIVVVPTVNPDGCLALGMRQNAHGVDLNRNFPSNWARIGRPGSFQWSGPRPLSEPESRIARRLILRLRPKLSLWFHQPQAVVRAWGPSIPAARRYARLAGVPFRALAWPNGTASNWQNHLDPHAASFVVELPGGPLTPSAAKPCADALLRLAQ